MGDEGMLPAEQAQREMIKTVLKRRPVKYVERGRPINSNLYEEMQDIPYETRFGEKITLLEAVTRDLIDHQRETGPSVTEAEILSRFEAEYNRHQKKTYAINWDATAA